MKRFDGKDGCILVSALECLTPAERGEVPRHLGHLVDHWQDVVTNMPSAFSWASSTLRGRRPILGRTPKPGVSKGAIQWQWSVQMPLFGDEKRLQEPCFGCRRLSPISKSLPTELAWLSATFGDCFVERQVSGTAPWGVPLKSVRHRMFSGVFELLPAAAADWVVLYEADGDWLCADLESGRAHWTGLEWTGEPDVGFPDWRRVMHFVFWRMLDDGWVLPTDLEMLFAKSQ